MVSITVIIVFFWPLTPYLQGASSSRSYCWTTSYMLSQLERSTGNKYHSFYCSCPVWFVLWHVLLETMNETCRRVPLNTSLFLVLLNVLIMSCSHHLLCCRPPENRGIGWCMYLTLAVEGWVEKTGGDGLSWVCRIVCESRLRLLEREPSLDAIFEPLCNLCKLQEFT